MKSERERVAVAPVELAVGDLYRAHGRQVTRWAAHLGGPTIDVDDAVQEVFLAAHRQRATFRGEARITTWLYGITVRVVSKLRRRARWRRWLSGSANDTAGEIASRRLTPVDELEQRQNQARVYQVLDRLSAGHRTVLVLFEIEGHSGEEIAALTGHKLATIWVQLHRARAAFLRELARVEGVGR